MSNATTHLNLPYILPSQAQKHVTHNEALDLVDALMHLAVVDIVGQQPDNPARGDRHIVGAGATGPWSGHEGQIAQFLDGRWDFIAPRPGFVAWRIDQSRLIYWTGIEWRGVVETLQQVERFGLGTAADAGNPFAAKLNNALWTARSVGEGGTGNLRYAMNKEASGNTLSLLFQSAYSGRAELGLVGTDDLSLKVSPDGAAWSTALSVNRASGLSTVAGDPTSNLGIATKQYVDARPASAIASAPTGAVAASNVQAAIDELDADKMSRGGDSVSGAYSFGGLVSASGGFAISGGPLSYTRDATSAVLRVINYRDTNASHVSFVGDVARGTQAAPAFMTATGQMLEFAVRPYDGTAVGVTTSGRFSFRASENHSSTARGTSMTVELAPNGGATVQEVASFGADSGLSLFGANPVIDQNRHHRLRSYTVAALPAASPAGQLIRVSNGSSNRQLALSDGANWRFPDGALVA